MITPRQVSFSAIICLFALACSSPAEDPSNHSASDTGQPDATLEPSDAHAPDPDANVPDPSDTALDTSPDVRPGTDDPSPNEDEHDDDCHYDCFGEFECRDGQVYERFHAPIPCNHPDYDTLVAQCITGTLVGSCEQGCATVTNYRYDVFNDPWTIMCEEGRPRIVGDPCQTNADCTPSLQMVIAPPDSTPRPLICNETTQRCVDPDHTDYLNWCNLDATPATSDDPTYLAAPGCAAEHCLLKRAFRDNHCQGCTMPCESSEDCPAGSYCARLTELTTVNAPPALQRTSRLCAPLNLELSDCR
jgi:hypothetical protein